MERSCATIVPRRYGANGGSKFRPEQKVPLSLKIYGIQLFELHGPTLFHINQIERKNLLSVCGHIHFSENSFWKPFLTIVETLETIVLSEVDSSPPATRCSPTKKYIAAGGSDH